MNSVTKVTTEYSRSYTEQNFIIIIIIIIITITTTTTNNSNCSSIPYGQTSVSLHNLGVVHKLRNGPEVGYSFCQCNITLPCNMLSCRLLNKLTITSQPACYLLKIEAKFRISDALSSLGMGEMWVNFTSLNNVQPRLPSTAKWQIIGIGVGRLVDTGARALMHQRFYDSETARGSHGQI